MRRACLLCSCASVGPRTVLAGLAPGKATVPVGLTCSHFQGCRLAATKETGWAHRRPPSPYRSPRPPDQRGVQGPSLMTSPLGCPDTALQPESRPLTLPSDSVPWLQSTRRVDPVRECPFADRRASVRPPPPLSGYQPAALKVGTGDHGAAPAMPDAVTAHSVRGQTAAQDFRGNAHRMRPQWSKRSIPVAERRRAGTRSPQGRHANEGDITARG